LLCCFLQQAYREWQRNTSADALFIINNDVLVPDGVVNAMAAALTPAGKSAALYASMQE
jgi:hypothetical protein